MSEENKSEIANFREQQALEEQVAWLGLHGLASPVGSPQQYIA